MDLIRKLLKISARIIVWIPPILIALFIFGFSSQGGEESAGLSQKAAVIIINVADDINIINVTDENRNQMIESIQYPIRKCAHMSEYMIFAVSVLLALYIWKARGRMLYLTTFSSAFIFACTDEFHQLFVPGRSGRMTNVLIDSVGALIGLLIIYGINRRKK